MTKKQLIILDLDGVIVDLHSGICRVHNVSLEHYNAGSYDFTTGFGVHRDWYTGLDYNFWAGLGWTHDGKVILELLESIYGRERIVIWSRPIRDRECIPGKLEWIHSNLPEHYWHNCYFGQHKWLASLPGRTLIDDCDNNVLDFINYGGRGILVPRLWNTLHYLDAFEYLKREIR